MKSHFRAEVSFGARWYGTKTSLQSCKGEPANSLPRGIFSSSLDGSFLQKQFIKHMILFMSKIAITAPTSSLFCLLMCHHVLQQESVVEMALIMMHRGRCQQGATNVLYINRIF